jgi:Bacterial regulatory proteins, tetR family
MANSLSGSRRSAQAKWASSHYRRPILGSASIERLASAAGISRATFYNYFDDKAELLYAWFGRC